MDSPDRALGRPLVERCPRETRGSCETLGWKGSAIVTCKCKARTYTGHLKKVEQDGYPVHVYTGHYWAPKDDKNN